VDNLFQRKNILVILALLMMSCNQRYGYLSKIAMPVKRGIIAVEIKSLNPNELGNNFDSEIKEYAIKRLRKEGYKYSEKNPQYLLEVETRIDSSFNRGIAYGGPGVGSYAYSKKSKAILFDLVLKSKNNNLVIWRGSFDLYFFNEPARDLKRSKGVMRFLISDMND
jgi:hypothetical protein